MADSGSGFSNNMIGQSTFDEINLEYLTPSLKKEYTNTQTEEEQTLDRTCSQQTFEGVKSFAGSHSEFEDTFESVIESQSPIKFITDSQTERCLQILSVILQKT